jgi:hypothetical protein
MTHRMLDGKIIETQEEMAECGLHGGDWDNQGGLCIIRDLDEYANYIDHVRTDIRLGQERAEDEEEAAKAESSDSIPVKQGIPLSDLRLESSGITQEMVQDTIEEAKRLAYTGISPDSPVAQNENGGLQSVVEGRFDLLPPVAMFELAQVMEHGAQKYAPRNWMKISVDSHLNHLLMHVFAYLAGDRQEEHLTHALARAAMAVEIEKLGVQD